MNDHNSPTPFLCDLEAYDPRSPQTSPERRFCCPSCGDGKGKDSAHRSLSVNVQTGAFRCHRCDFTGKLRDFWTETNASDRSNFTNSSFGRRRKSRVEPVRVSEKTVVAPVQEETATPEETPPWRVAVEKSKPLDQTGGETYLRSRGVSLAVAVSAGVRFSPSWYGRPAVLFPLCDRAGDLVAAQVRFLTAREGRPKTMTGGSKKRGVFSTGGAFEALRQGAPLIITEAPLDALSIAEAGFPAFAFCGTDPPTWFHVLGGKRRVLLATDADDKGDQAADAMTALLDPFAATCQRLRPEGAKDWNEFLTTYGRDALHDFLTPPVLS